MIKQVFLISAMGLIILGSVAAQPTVKFTNYNSVNTPVFAGNNFKAVAVGKGNRIWAGTQYQGMYWFDTARKAWTSTGLFNNIFINHIVADKFGGVWVGQSGTSGTTGGASNVAGGINYFPDTTAVNIYTGSNQVLPSRNVRSIYLDKVSPAINGQRRLWATMGTYITSSNTAAGGIIKLQDSISNNVQRVWEGLQALPNTNAVSAGTPSCYGLCGDVNEVWVGAESNYQFASGSTTQILRYDAVTGKHLGGWDQNGGFDNTRLFYNNQSRNYVDTSTRGILPAGFRTTAMHVDAEGRRWVGLRAGGVVVKMGNKWIKVNLPDMFPAGTMVNFNAIASDEFGNVYIGTSTGLVVFQNGGDPSMAEDYKRYTITEGLPSNNITGMAYDTSATTMVLTSDAGVTFMSIKYKIDVKQIWDYSFPSREGNPVGVVADGTARVYLKIKKGSDTLPNVKAVRVQLKDYFDHQFEYRGKLKKALVINGYSEDGNFDRLRDVSVTSDDIRAGAPGEYWLWYIAPDDFSNGTLGSYYNRRRRFDTLTVMVTYENNKKDTMDYAIAIVRPPTVFVHGLASNPSCWDNTKHFYGDAFVPFVNSPVFTYTKALKMDGGGTFRKNAAQLLGGDLRSQGTGGDRFNTLQGSIEAIRDMGYAANQVDYVCHSMGGIMIREAIGVFPDKFYTKPSAPYAYKNYSAGFTHKIITVNTPHNSSTVADLVDEFVLPTNPAPLGLLLDGVYRFGEPTLGLDVKSFFLPVGQTIIGSYKSSDAVNNLQVNNRRGGIDLLLTKARHHMIIGDLNWEFMNTLEGGIGYVLTKLFSALLEISYALTYSDESFDQTQAEDTRRFLRGLMAENQTEGITHFFEWYSTQKGFPRFWSDGDGIVPLLSQTARLPINDPRVTLYTPTSGINAHHIFILNRLDVGTKIFDLLNTPLSSSTFADVIPENIDPDPGKLVRNRVRSNEAPRPAATPVYGSFFDTTKIRVDAPLRGATVYGDSMIYIKFRLKDTARLAYVGIHFQGADSIRVQKVLTQQTIAVRADRSRLASNKLIAMAVYDRASGDGVNFYTDTLSVNVDNLATLQDFRAVQDIVEVRAGEPQVISYEAKYDDVWIPLHQGNPGITVSIDSASILTYDPTSYEFSGVKTGTALADFSYKGFNDNVLFKVYLPYNGNCINRTIAGGSFKNPAIWSKGTVPDICDSVIISAAHSVTLDTSVTIRALRISLGGTLTINNAARTLQLGQPDDGYSIADNYGTLNISKGKLGVNGRLRLNAASTFNMTGGSVVIDGNTNVKETSVDNGGYLFEVAAGMQSFNFSGDTLQLIDPPFGAISQAISCTYNFGINTTLILGNGLSLDKSNNVNGFGGSLFPPLIGKLIVDAKAITGNRQLTVTKPLNVRGKFEVRTGSDVKLQSELRVTP